MKKRFFTKACSYYLPILDFRSYSTYAMAFWLPRLHAQRQRLRRYFVQLDTHELVRKNLVQREKLSDTAVCTTSGKEPTFERH